MFILEVVRFFNKYGIKSRNIILMYLNALLSGMLFFLPILALYLEKHLFTLTNVALIYSLRSLFFVIFEYPTGAIADLLGRKKALVLSKFFILLGVIFLVIGGNLWMFILYAIIFAFGGSLFSGADSAFIYDTLKQEGKEKYFKKIIGTKYAIWPIGASIGSIVGGYMATISLSFPVVLSLIPVTITLITSFFLKEPSYEKSIHRNIFKHMLDASKIIIKNYQLIILLLSALVLVGMGDSIHYLKPIFFRFKEIPILYFGYIFAISFVLSSIGHYISHDVAEFFGDKKTVILSAFFLCLFILLATLVGPWIAVSFLLIKQVFYGMGRPATEHLLNLETDSKTRATVISGYNFMRHLGVFIFAILLGHVAGLYTINIGFRVGSILMFSVPLIFLLLKDKR